MALIVALIILGIWGCIVIIGAIVMSIAKIKANANPINKLFNVKKEEEK